MQVSCDHGVPQTCVSVFLLSCKTEGNGVSQIYIFLEFIIKWKQNVIYVMMKKMILF